MITAIVQFQLPAPVSLQEATRMFESTAPKYQNLPGLIRKYYLRSEDGRTAGGAFICGSRGRRRKKSTAANGASASPSSMATRRRSSISTRR
jgi:hypothetical protein